MNAITDVASRHFLTVRKNLNFLDESTPKYWYQNSPFKSRFADALQLVFPDGERYFIESVRAYRDEITDPKLKKDVADFIRQEAQHGIAHDKVNQRLRDQGIPVDKMLDVVKTLMQRMTKEYTREFNIAHTAATEHLTALMAKCFFEYKETMTDVDPYMRGLLAWHAVEEMEHRAVCFDVMADVADVDQKTRNRAMLMVSIALPVFTTYRTNIMLKTDGFNALERTLMITKGLNWIFGKDGMLSNVAGEYMAWYTPDFHPDNYPMVHNYEQWCEIYEETGDPIAAGNAMWEAGYTTQKQSVPTTKNKISVFSDIILQSLFNMPKLKKAA